jgi:hypothetical protein
MSRELSPSERERMMEVDLPQAEVQALNAALLSWDGHDYDDVPLLVWLACREWAEERHVERERLLREALLWALDRIEAMSGPVVEPWPSFDRARALASPTTPRRGLREKLDEMRLHDNTGDPLDVGYMQAVEELVQWLASPTPQETATDTEPAQPTFTHPELMDLLDAHAEWAEPDLMRQPPQVALRNKLLQALGRTSQESPR